ncbi:TPD1 protein homolog 1-like [Carica papaya]|uniref:TPD1 protein homolog 1-like n=1 Tax=Carica papaya TaxID=3649 RepID=UPI000B8CEF65|nr:TPD1 protein homolog 1-like [Carica papaya]
MSTICHLCSFSMIFLLVVCGLALFSESSNKIKLQYFSSHGDYKSNQSSTQANLKAEQAYSIHRKLLLLGTCRSTDISISQSRSSSSGIPQFIVQIMNTCTVSGCAPSAIHLYCGWFASDRMVNPTIFKRLSYDDCLVNGGKGLKSSQIIRFTYSNSFMYPMHFKSAKFC